MKFTLNQIISTIPLTERINVCVIDSDEESITYETSNDRLDNVFDLINSRVYGIIKDYPVDRVWYGERTHAIIIEVMEVV